MARSFDLHNKNVNPSTNMVGLDKCEIRDYWKKFVLSCSESRQPGLSCTDRDFLSPDTQEGRRQRAHSPSSNPLGVSWFLGGGLVGRSSRPGRQPLQRARRGCAPSNQPSPSLGKWTWPHQAACHWTIGPLRKLWPIWALADGRGSPSQSKHHGQSRKRCKHQTNSPIPEPVIGKDTI